MLYIEYYGILILNGILERPRGGVGREKFFVSAITPAAFAPSM
jgi:hypothetical protein